MPSMPSLELKCMLLCVLMHGAVRACTLKNHTLWIESDDCAQCVSVNTTICSGYCYTQDTNLRGRFGKIFLIQRGCMPLSLVYRDAHVPGCPQLYYPEARCCSCRRCHTQTHHCIHSTRPIIDDRCTMSLGAVKNQTRPPVRT